MSRRFVITGTVIAVLLGGLAAWHYVFLPQLIRSSMSQMQPPAATVTTEATKLEKWGEQLTSIGTLIASQGVDVTTQVAGVVTDIYFESGQDVTQGAKLVQLDVAVELADLASGKATLQEAEVAFQRQTDLITKRVTSEANLDIARAKRDTALASVKRVEAVIAQKLILAPFSGRLGIRKVEKGQYVSPGVVMTSLQALDPIRVDFPMPEQNIGKLGIREPIDLTVDAFPKQIFKGAIQSLDARVAQDTRTLLVRGILPNKELKLLPGMFANVVVHAGEPADVVTVPRTAVTYSLYGDSVYVVKPAAPKADQPKAAEGVDPPLTAERRFVKTGPMREDRVAILSGLEAGEEVITTGQLKLNPGATVKVDNTQPLNRPAERPKQ
jgi:membrane fusion protein (multidrug efflux system)